jgi:hypothetical protein
MRFRNCYLAIKLRNCCTLGVIAFQLTSDATVSTLALNLPSIQLRALRF